MTHQDACDLNAWFWRHPLTEITASGWYRFGGASTSRQRLWERAEELNKDPQHLELARQYVHG